MPETEASGNLTVRPMTVSRHVVSERLDHALEHLARVQRAGVVHRGEDAVELDRRVEAVAHLVDRLHQQGHAAQREELALERDQYSVRGGQRVDGQQTERRLAVDEDHVVVGRDLAEHPGEDRLARDLVDQVHLGRRQVDVRGRMSRPSTRVETMTSRGSRLVSSNRS